MPVNYRLADEQLRAILARTAPSVIVVDDPVVARVGAIEGVELVTRPTFLSEINDLPAGATSEFGDPDDIAILLFTSGTTGEPKGRGAAPQAPGVLRHRHGRVHGRRRGRGRTGQRAPVSRRGHLRGAAPRCTPDGGSSTWRRSRPRRGSPTARDEAITQAMVVPTMLGRILDILEATASGSSDLRHSVVWRRAGCRSR